MDNSHRFRAEDQTGKEQSWWLKLSLYPTALRDSPDSDEVRAAQLDALRRYQPTGFVAEDGTALTLTELAEILEAADQADIDRREARFRSNTVKGQQRMDTALAAADADALITEGRWEGFTRGTVIAWCWNLFDYEPVGLMYPNSQVRAEAIIRLKQGEIPAVFNYPERARKLEASGLTPIDYRHFKIALGAQVFDPADVVRS